MIHIQHLKFGSSVMVCGRQEASVVAGKTRVGETTISYDSKTQIYEIVRNGKTVFVHSTNVQYSVPLELHTVDDHYEHEDHSFDLSTSANEIPLDQQHQDEIDEPAKPQAARRGGRPRTKA